MSQRRESEGAALRSGSSMSVDKKQHKAFNVQLRCSAAPTQIGTKHWGAACGSIAREPNVPCNVRALRHVRKHGVAQVEHEPVYHDGRYASRMNKPSIRLAYSDRAR
jgi:hypothetical protein